MIRRYNSGSGWTIPSRRNGLRATRKKLHNAVRVGYASGTEVRVDIVHPEGGYVTDQPRIFVSAVSREFHSARFQVADVLRRLACEPVWQEISGTEPDDLRPALREKIRSCDGLIQIVGEAYGPEPPAWDEKLGRVSYAQFEYLFARQKGKKTWLIFADLGETGRFAENRFDKPLDPNHPDPEGYQLERQILQEEYRERLEAETQPSIEAANESEIRSQVERKKDEFDRLRVAGVSRRQRSKQILAVVALLLAAAALSGGAWAAIRVYHSRQVASAVASLDSDRIRSHLERSVSAAFDRQATEAHRVADAKSRQKAVLLAEQWRDRELTQVEPTVAFLRRTIVREEASPEFVETSRRLQDEGVDSALVFLVGQEPQLLGDADHWKTMPPPDVRRVLAPLLVETVLFRQRGDLPAAGRICERLLMGDADWPDARFHYAMTMMALAERALGDDRPTAAWQRFVLARVATDRLVQTKQMDPLWVSSLSNLYRRLGDLSEEEGHPEEARELYMKQLDCAKDWAAAEPENTTAQSELSRVLVKAGELNVRRGHFKSAEEFHAQGLKIAEKLAARDPGSPARQQDLSNVYIDVGDIWARLGILRVAQKHFARSLSIQKQLAAAHPGEQSLQQELAAGYERLASAKQDAARELYQSALTVRLNLATARPADKQSQRELAAAYERLADASPRNLSAEIYGQSLAVRKTLAESDRTNAKARRELLAVYKKAAVANIRDQRLDRARAFYEQSLDFIKRQSVVEPANQEIQLQLSDQYDELGNLSQQLGQFDASKDFYQQSLDIRTRVANNDPADGVTLRDLCQSYLHLARLAETVGNIDGAIQICERGIAEYQRLGETPTLQALTHRHLVRLELQYAQHVESRDIAGALEPLLKERNEGLPNLLRRRCRLLAARKDIEGVARTAAALRDLDPKSANNLYLAACGYGLCAKLAAGWPGAGPFQSATAPDKNPDKSQSRTADERKYRDTAIDLLQNAVNAGYLQMRSAAQDQDLAALHELPEFKTLVSRSPKPRRSIVGG